MIKHIGAAPDRVNYYEPYGVSKAQIELYICRPEFTRHIINHGCTYKKSKTIELPIFDTRELNLCFLMGYFDGDGNEKGTVISCGSVTFLKGIKDFYNLKFEITTRDTTLNLNLGSDLFKNMMAAYPESLPRKRKTNSKYYFNAKMEQPTKPLSYDKPNMRLFDPSPEELEKLVWEQPLTKLGEHFGVSGNAVKKRCKKYGIKTPGRGYWDKIPACG